MLWSFLVFIEKSLNFFKASNDPLLLLGVLSDLLDLNLYAEFIE
jgi:hypothetical protein